MLKILKLDCRLREAHFGTAFSNNSIKLSSNIPSKSMILGMIGASKGLSMKESQKQSYEISFKWKDRENVCSQLVKMNRLMYEGSLKTKNILSTDRWYKGEPSTKIDSIEYLYNKKGNLKFEIIISNIEEDIEYLIEKLKSPEYPLYLGKSESLLVIENIEIYNTVKQFDENYFEDLFIGESKSYVLKERLVEKMDNYREPEKLESVYTLKNKMKGLTKKGYVLINNNTYCLW